MIVIRNHDKSDRLYGVKVPYQDVPVPLTVIIEPGNEIMIDTNTLVNIGLADVGPVDYKELKRPLEKCSG